MQKSSKPEAVASYAQPATFSIVLALSFAHLLNDMMQSLLPAIYPIIKDTYGLDFGQIGLITLAFQLTASLLQPLVGIYTDRRPQPYSLVVGMGATLLGLIVLAHAGSYLMLLLGAALVGSGSSVFHPESTRMARLASGGRHGFAQSLFQVGGQAGQALGPLLAAFIVVPRGQASLSWFSLVALFAMPVLMQVGRWYKRQSPAPVKPRLRSAGSSRRFASAVTWFEAISPIKSIAALAPLFTRVPPELQPPRLCRSSVHKFATPGSLAAACHERKQEPGPDYDATRAHSEAAHGALDSQGTK